METVQIASKILEAKYTVAEGEGFKENHFVLSLSMWKILGLTIIYYIPKIINLVGHFIN